MSDRDPVDESTGIGRRRFLAVFGAGALAGCRTASPGSGGAVNDSGGTVTEPDYYANDNATTASGAPTNAAGGTATGAGPSNPGVGDVDLPVSQEELHRGAPKDLIPAITDPVFAADWSDYELSRESSDESADLTLVDADEVIGVERDGEARAYPLRVLNFHEVVNDDFGGPLLVTYCPLCASGVTAIRRVDGEPTIFGVSGLLWNSDLVMYDEATESLWSQILGTAIRGEKTGTDLELVPSTLTTWGEWRETHPDTRVLVPPPESNTVVGRDVFRDYRFNPYDDYEASSEIGIGRNSFGDFRLVPKSEVLGISHGGVARAYPRETVTERRVVNDIVGGKPVVVAATPDDAMVAYDRVVDDETLRFETTDDPALLRAGGSRWRVTTGTAVDGPHEGVELDPATVHSSMFWFAWAEFNPETGVYGQ